MEKRISYGINVDEMGMAYDSWCLGRFGVDRYLNEYPVYLINFSGGQSALYSYLCTSYLEKRTRFFVLTGITGGSSDNN